VSPPAPPYPPSQQDSFPSDDLGSVCLQCTLARSIACLVFMAIEHFRDLAACVLFVRVVGVKCNVFSPPPSSQPPNRIWIPGVGIVAGGL
jgi:hypothetical protein